MDETNPIVGECKWNGKPFKLQLENDATLKTMKEIIFSLTGVRPDRQKLLGVGRGVKDINDDMSIVELKLKHGFKFKMMGTAEDKLEAIKAVEEAAAEEIFDVVDDLDWEYSAEDSTELQQNAEAQLALQKAIRKTKIRHIVAPREGKKLLVLDLDHTLLHFNKEFRGPVEDLKRPHMDRFLSALHEHYDFAVWSQTSWRWLELKITELGMLSHPSYHITFVLDQTSMFKIQRNHKGKQLYHAVKALDIIWANFPQWGPHNTVHLDDLSRNFAMNPQSGLKCKCYKRDQIESDFELLELGVYLKHVAENHDDFTGLDHNKWKKILKKINTQQTSATATASSTTSSSKRSSVKRKSSKK